MKDASGNALASYAYDARGRRMTETHGGVTTDVYFDANWQVIEERQAGAITAQYVWSADGYPDDLVLRDSNALPGGLGAGGSGLGQRLYVQQDADHSVTALTDASGNVVERFLYDPYGARTVLSATWASTADTANWIYCFQGGRSDPVTGFVNFRNRETSASLRRWLEQDPAGYVNGPDVYQIELSGPVDQVDPLGLESYAIAPIVRDTGNILSWTEIGASLAISGIAYDARSIYGFLDGANQLDETVASIDLQEMKILAMQRRNQELRRRLAESGGKTPDGQRGEQCATGPLASESEKKTAPPTTQAATTQASGNAAESGTGGVGETFKDPADAIGDLNGEANLAGKGKTTNQYWIDHGFTETEYYTDSNGDKWTVFKNPTTGEYSGGHLSSGQ